MGGPGRAGPALRTADRGSGAGLVAAGGGAGPGLAAAAAVCVTADLHPGHSPRD